ncbi:MAG: hypothetical protein K8F60_01105 [Melioribacteraceae bacterium]|nr:hypothetical protein [Melioribacteraceae bacterium]
MEEEIILDHETALQTKSINDSLALKGIIEFKLNKDVHEYQLVDLETVINEAYVGKPIKFIGYVKYMTGGSPETTSVGKSNLRFTVYHFSIEDINGCSIDCFPILHDYYKGVINSLLNESKKLTFYGTIISIDDIKNKSYNFLPMKIEDEIPASEQLRVKESDKAKYDEILEKAKKGELNLRDYVKGKLIKNIGIKGLDEAKELSTAIDFIILQSFSQGKSKDGRYSNKLHSLVIGPPAVGKKLITQSALALNTHNYEIQPTAAKITPAGLIGNVIRNGNGILTSPGILSKASNGVVCIQDYHELTKKKNSNFSDTFSKVMEDGEVVDSTSSRTVLPAVTSIHVDMNRLSQVGNSKDNDIHADLRIPLNIISRFDFIIDIPADLKRQIYVVFDMMEGKKILSNGSEISSIPQWIIELRYLIEKTKEEYVTIELEADISEYIITKFKHLVESNDKYLGMMQNFSSMLTRIQISIEKMIKAIACSSMSKKGKEEHVDYAFKFLKHKLEFLQKLDPIEIPDNFDQNIDEKSRREGIITKLVKEKRSLKTEDIRKEVNKRMKKEYNIKTIQRDLKLLSSRNRINSSKKGIWKLGE